MSKNFPQRVRGPQCPLNIRTDGRGNFQATGTYEAPNALFAGLGGFGSLGGIGAASPPVKYMLKIEGTIQGHAIVAWITRMKDGEVPSVLSEGENDAAALMILSDNKK